MVRIRMQHLGDRVLISENTDRKVIEIIHENVVKIKIYSIKCVHMYLLSDMCLSGCSCANHHCVSVGCDIRESADSRGNCKVERFL